mmetsp:Transcript_19419/g.33323  ORF Transcript_19419/g.33323 Transcript_19419/m.33323 type:complete len:437 (+) Transcript_19419:45-1355(+)|eukprot:CAMPEP_0183730314 /NCGR_PEP_ID=MMETSP0737-20130205/32542_1 /TAXON_ID=385413 /ORGANISM="Thalassiosira miniscula, Strain CCMP1093" /LENGTH=436 /DNA_ID=CAMNT_0025962773 /DNA_START=70 /DNA_END=1380 /DNA_ORIENTATION=-
MQSVPLAATILFSTLFQTNGVYAKQVNMFHPEDRNQDLPCQPSCFYQGNVDQSLSRLNHNVSIEIIDYSRDINEQDTFGDNDKRSAPINLWSYDDITVSAIDVEGNGHYNAGQNISFTNTTLASGYPFSTSNSTGVALSLPALGGITNLSNRASEGKINSHEPKEFSTMRINSMPAASVELKVCSTSLTSITSTTAPTSAMMEKPSPLMSPTLYPSHLTQTPSQNEWSHNHSTTTTKGDLSFPTVIASPTFYPTDSKGDYDLIGKESKKLSWAYGRSQDDRTHSARRVSSSPTTLLSPTMAPTLTIAEKSNLMRSSTSYPSHLAQSPSQHSKSHSSSDTTDTESKEVSSFPTVITSPTFYPTDTKLNNDLRGKKSKKLSWTYGRSQDDRSHNPSIAMTRRVSSSPTMVSSPTMAPSLTIEKKYFDTRSISRRPEPQ